MQARTRAIFNTNRRIFSAALLAAHAANPQVGFRQKDLKFLFELFFTWSEQFFDDELDPINNTQFARALSQLSNEGFVKVRSGSGIPHYSLTRPGLIDSVQSLVSNLSPSRIAETLFVFYFIRNYSEKIILLVKESSATFPPAFKLELEVLLDLGELKRSLLRKTDQQLIKLRTYTARCESVSQKAIKIIQTGGQLGEVVKLLEHENPYQLNSSRPLRQLQKELPSDIAHWEMTVGPLKRANEMWNPILQILEKYRDVLNKL